MATAANSLKWCVRANGRRGCSGLRPSRVSPLAVTTTTTAAAAAAASSRATPLLTLARSLSLTAARRAQNPSENDPDEQAYEQALAELTKQRSVREMLKEVTPEEREQMELSETRIEELEKLVKEARSEFRKAQQAHEVPLSAQKSSMNEGELDPDLISDASILEEEFQEDDMLGMSHAKLEEHRDMREYARIAVWEMPLLSKYAKAFEAPSGEQPLRWRYTTYMGEFHPAEKKVVVELCPDDLPLTDVQKSKLRKIVGTRYNPEKDSIKMSCEMFEHPAQNKRYLGDLVAKLIAEAKDATDTFEDVPIDTRHHQFKAKPKFPREWRMTEERRQRLAELRQAAYQLDTGKKAEGDLVDGKQKIQRALAPPPTPPTPEAGSGGIEDALAELVAVGRGRRATIPRPRDGLR